MKKLKFEEIAQDLSTQFVQNWYPKFTSNLTIFVRFILKLSSYFKTGTIFWVILKNIRLPWIQAKMQPKSQQVEWTRQIFAEKLPKITNIPTYNVIIQVKFNISIYFCFIEPTAGVNESKIWPKIANTPIINKHNTPLVSLDNSSTMKIFQIYL